MWLKEKKRCNFFFEKKNAKFRVLFIYLFFSDREKKKDHKQKIKMQCWTDEVKKCVIDRQEMVLKLETKVVLNTEWQSTISFPTNYPETALRNCAYNRHLFLFSGSFFKNACRHKDEIGTILGEETLLIRRFYVYPKLMEVNKTEEEQIMLRCLGRICLDIILGHILNFYSTQTMSIQLEASGETYDKQEEVLIRAYYQKLSKEILIEKINNLHILQMKDLEVYLGAKKLSHYENKFGYSVAYWPLNVIQDCFLEAIIRLESNFNLQSYYTRHWNFRVIEQFIGYARMQTDYTLPRHLNVSDSDSKAGKKRVSCHADDLLLQKQTFKKSSK